MNKFKFNDFFNYKKIIHYLYTIVFNLQNHPTFHSEEKVGQLSKRKRVLSWSIYIISLRLEEMKKVNHIHICELILQTYSYI